MNDYIINQGTLMLIENRKGNTKIYEDKTYFKVDMKLSTVISNSCKYYGSSYHGRIEGTKEMIKHKMKLPIILEESIGFIIFPISSPRRENCTWIVFSNIKTYYQIDSFNTRIIFMNNIYIDVPVSYRIIENQMNRSRQLYYELQIRKNAMKILHK